MSVGRGRPYAVAFLIGATFYAALEILWRGFTHWSMLLTGGACLAGLYGLRKSMKSKRRFGFCLAGCLLITSAEFIVGCIVNLLLGWRVWDYSRVWGNLWGQICLPYSLLWGVLTLPAGWICDKICGYFSESNS